MKTSNRYRQNNNMSRVPNKLKTKKLAHSAKAYPIRQHLSAHSI